MRYSAGYLLAGMLLAQGASLSSLPVEMGASEKTEMHYLTAMNQSVDRAHKGDRLNISVMRMQKEPQSYDPETVLVGCDPAFSLLSGFHVRFFGRCTT